MKLHMIGCSHHQTPLQLREQLAFSDQQAVQALNAIREKFPDSEGVLLSTCNRIEVYVAGKSESQVPTHDWLTRFIADFHSVSIRDIEPLMARKSDRDSIIHLFSVAASLDSLVIGETQISSQVKQAYELARNSDHAGTLIHSLFQHASHTAKRVSNETEIHRRRISVPSVAVSEIATEFFERLDDKQVLVIGSGEMGEETLRYLVDAGAKRISLINRSRERADKVASQYGATVLDWGLLNDSIANADLVISTTGATEPIVTNATFRSILGKRKKGAMLILDLAVPRDFEESIGQLPEVYLYAIDDLQKVCQRNAAWREQQWPKAQRIILDEADRFIHDIQHRSNIPTIQQLRQQADDIKVAEWNRLKGKLANHSLSTEAEQEIMQSFERLVNKLLHPPLQSLREESRSEDHATLLDAVRRLFQLRD